MTFHSLILRSLTYCLILSGCTLEFFFGFTAQSAYSQTQSCNIGSNPKHPGNYKLLGSIFLGQKRFQKALDCFELALQDERGIKDPELWNNHGLALAGLKKFDRAIASYDKALQISPGAIFVDRVEPKAKAEDYYLWWFNRGTALVDLNRYEEAIASLDQSIKIKPNYSFVWFFRGLALFRLERYEEARAAYRRAVLLSPNTPYIASKDLISLQDYLVYYGQAEAKSRLGSYQDTIQAFERGQKIRRSNPQIKLIEDKSSENLYEAFIDGIRLLDQGDNKKALITFEQLIAQKPDYTNAWFGKADALTALQLYPEAILAYDRVISIEPDDYASWYKKGNVLRKVNRKEEALQAYQTAIDLSGGFSEVWHNRGVIFYDLNKDAEAINAYSLSLKANNLWGGIARIDTQYALAATLYRAKRYNESLFAVEKVLQEQPTYQEALELRKLIKKIMRCDRAKTPSECSVEPTPSK
jgi:tetratricopeptide (TPR) repeat protein